MHSSVALQPPRRVGGQATLQPAYCPRWDIPLQSQPGRATPWCQPTQRATKGEQALSYNHRCLETTIARWPWQQERLALHHLLRFCLLGSWKWSCVAAVINIHLVSDIRNRFYCFARSWLNKRSFQTVSAGCVARNKAARNTCAPQRCCRRLVGHRHSTLRRAWNWNAMQTRPTLHHLKYDRHFRACLKVVFGSGCLRGTLYQFNLFIVVFISEYMRPPLKHLADYCKSVSKMLWRPYFFCRVI